MATMRSFSPLSCARISALEFGLLFAGLVGSKGMVKRDEGSGIRDEG
jgi:hypothetical protein